MMLNPMPDDWTDHLPPYEISAADYAALPEHVCRRIEVVEGHIVMSPSPTRLHQYVVATLWAALNAQCPNGLRANLDVDLRLGDVPFHNRRPDVVVYTADLPNEAVLRREHVALVVEVMSPGSVLEDTMFKPAVYATGGIPNFWRVELEPYCVHTFRLGDSEYIEAGTFTKVLAVDHPFPFRVDLKSLLP